jgi:hypothetical protein
VLNNSCIGKPLGSKKPRGGPDMKNGHLEGRPRVLLRESVGA